MAFGTWRIKRGFRYARIRRLLALGMENRPISLRGKY